MKLETPKVGMIVDLILDGNILSSHLSIIKKDEAWLISQLKAKNIKDIKDVVFAGLQADGQIYIVKNNV